MTEQSAALELHLRSLEQVHRFTRCPHHLFCVRVRGPLVNAHVIHEALPADLDYAKSEQKARRMVREAAIEDLKEEQR